MNNENAVAALRMQISARRELKVTKCSPPLSYLKGNAQSGGPALQGHLELGGHWLN